MSMRLVRHWCLGLLLGLLVGGVPLIWAHTSGPQVDPFDHIVSYLVWVGGVFVAAFGLARVRRKRRWLGAFAVFSGFFSAVVIGIVVESLTGRFPNILWPLTITLSVLVGVLPAVIGGYFDSKLRRRAD